MKSFVWALCVGLVGGDESCTKESDPIAMIQSKSRSQLLKNEGESQLDSVLAEIAQDGLSAKEVASKAALLLRATQTISVGFDSLPVATKIKLLQASKKLQTSIGAAPELAEIFEGHQQELLQAAAALERSAAESPGLPSILANNSISALEMGTVDEAIARKRDDALPKGNCILGCRCMKEPRNFNATEYIRATWYIQMQQTNGFQQRSDLYCVTATYNETFRGRKLDVAGRQPDKLITAFNNCNKGRTNSGTQCARHSDKNFKPSFGTPLCARIYDKNHPSRLKVAPCGLPKGFTGDYWVVGAGPSSDNYEWAIVTAGQPSVKVGDRGFCTTPDYCIGPAQANCGLWLFTRARVASKATMAAMKKEAWSQGITLTKTISIDHSKCDYDGYFLKPDISKNVVELAQSVDDLSTLATAVVAADLVQTLSAAGPFTVFAPQNAAFGALPAGTLTDLLKPENKDQLVSILTYHVVGAKAESKDLSDGQTITTVQGGDVTVSTSDGVQINSANVVQADVMATNGVVHVIDAVLTPP